MSPEMWRRMSGASNLSVAASLHPRHSVSSSNTNPYLNSPNLSCHDLSLNQPFGEVAQSFGDASLVINDAFPPRRNSRFGHVKFIHLWLCQKRGQGYSSCTLKKIFLTGGGGGEGSWSGRRIQRCCISFRSCLAHVIEADSVFFQ